MRLFVAIDLDERARRAIAAEQTRLAEAMGVRRAAVRWARPEHLHLTLVFVADAPDARLPDLVAALSAAMNRKPFSLVLGSLGVFPSRGAPRAVWLGVTGGEPELRAVQREVADRIERVGIALEPRPFAPHLTLGRSKASRPSDRGLMLAAASSGVIARVRVDHATLYLSRPTSEGPRYTELARVNLTA
jgi:RNA 2',3'-cyclic 3'-phosphodiesterase